MDDADLAVEYAKCKDKHSTVILLWEEARKKLDAFAKEMAK